MYEGYFLPNTDTGGGEGAGITVAEFDNCNCGKRVIGDARYRDQTFDAGGISARMMRRSATQRSTSTKSTVSRMPQAAARTRRTP